MKYLIAKFNVNSPDGLHNTACDLLAAAAGEVGFEAFEESEDGLDGYIQEQLFDKTELDKAIKSINLPDIEIEYTLKTVEDKDWNQQWEDNGFEPIRIDNKCIIYDAKHTNRQDVPEDENASIFIDAKQAFGTGTHETTRMIVGVLMNMNLNGKHILDCGCGTGILSIAASKAGAADIIAYDIDCWSVKNAEHNADINNVKNIKVMEGDVSILEKMDCKFDIVMANINRNILLADMTTFRKVMKNDAILILSGFYEEDIPLLMKKASQLNLIEEDKITSDRWACIVLKASDKI